MSKLNNWIVRKIARVEAEEGQGLAEYALILALIAVVCATALTGLQGSISGVLSSVGTAMSAA